jgi:hypothetical protein
MSPTGASSMDGVNAVRSPAGTSSSTVIPSAPDDGESPPREKAADTLPMSLEQYCRALSASVCCVVGSTSSSFRGVCVLRAN